MNSLTFTIAGAVNVQVTVTELGDGSLQFDLTVLDETGQIGDLNAIFFDLSNDDITYDLTVAGDSVTGTAFKVDGVTKVDNYTNMNGEVVNEYGKFDVGVQFGTSGMAKDDIREASFVLTGTDGPLSLDDIALQDFGVRLTSVGVEGGSRDGSLKLGGTAPEAEDPPPPPPNPDVPDAIDDYMEVVLGDADEFDYVNGDDFSVLQNDLAADGVTSYFATGGGVSGLTDDDYVITLMGSNGGTLDLYVDGATDFHDNGDFGDLGPGGSAVTEFYYQIDGGDMATIYVTVYADDIGMG